MNPPVPPDDMIAQYMENSSAIGLVAICKECASFFAAWGATQGADEQLRLCVEWLRKRGLDHGVITELRTAMRPPSLKQKALGDVNMWILTGRNEGYSESIIEALESIPE